MLSLNTLRTKFSIVLVALLAIALLSFILGEFKGCSQNEDPEVGTITANGETQSVAYSEFLGSYNDALVWMDNGDAQRKVDAAAIVQGAWHLFKSQNVALPALEELGLVVTEDERVAMWNCQSPSRVIGNDPIQVQSFKDDVNAGNVEYRKYEIINKMAVLDRVEEKFVDLVMAGSYVNSLMVEKGVAANNNAYNVKYVACDYSSIPNSEVEVSQEEIEAYYEANKANYTQTPYRTINYAHFDIKASEEDDAAIKAKAEVAVEKLRNAEDISKYAASHISKGQSFEILTGAELDSISNNKVYGLEKKHDAEDGYYYASRKIESRIVPKTFKLQHIVLPLDEALIDSVYAKATAKGADFEALVEEYSVDQITNESISYAQLPTLEPEYYVPGRIEKPGFRTAELIDALETAKVGDVVVVKDLVAQLNGQQYGGLALISKVVEVGEKVRHYRLAKMTYKVVESAATRDGIYNSAAEFAQKASGSVENFENAETSVLKTSTEVSKQAREVVGLNNSLELLRWAYKAEVGEVSPVFDLKESGWVVAVVAAVNDSEYKSVDEVSAQIKTVLINQKKAALLKDKMQGATLEEIAAKTESQVETAEGVKVGSTNGVESRVVAALAQVPAENAGEVLLVEGKSGVYAVVADVVAVSEEEQLDSALVKTMLQNEARMKVVGQSAQAVEKAVKVDDNTLQHF